MYLLYVRAIFVLMAKPKKVRYYAGAPVADRYPEIQDGRPTGRIVVVLAGAWRHVVVVPLQTYREFTRLISV